MDKTILEGMWKQIRGKARVWWSRLTENDLDLIAGRFDVLVGIIQEKYGLSRRQAMQEVTQRIVDYTAVYRKHDSRSDSIWR